MGDPSADFVDLPGHWLRGNLREMRSDPLGLYTRAQHTCGDYVRLSAVRAIHVYMLTHPDAVEQVLHRNHTNYRKPDLFYRAVSTLVGDGLFTNEGESWQSQRRLVAPAFHAAALAKLCGTILDAADALTREATVGAPIDIAAAMMKLGLRVASTTLFSTDFAADADAVGRAFKTAFQHVSDRMNSAQIVPGWLPTPAHRRFAKAKKRLDAVVTDIIATRRQATTPSDDLLSTMLAARDDAGRPMPERLLMDEVLTLLTAGHENIGAALAWTCHLLAEHADVQEQVADEVRGRSLGAESVSQLPLTRAVFEESMRLFPPGWGELRESIAADELQGRPLPAKSMVLLCQWVTHRHRDIWEAPDEFRPARFLPGAPPRHRFAYFPFGGGARVCIGMQLAMIEGVLVIARLCQQFRIERMAGQTVVPDATFTLQPRDGVKVILRRRP